MKQINNNLLRQFFTEPAKLQIDEHDSSEVRTKVVRSTDPTIHKIHSEIEQLKHDLKIFSLVILQKASKSKYQIETIRSLGKKILLIENQISNKQYLSTKSKLEINNRLKNYVFTFSVLKGEYLKPA